MAHPMVGFVEWYRAETWRQSNPGLALPLPWLYDFRQTMQLSGLKFLNPIRPSKSVHLYVCSFSIFLQSLDQKKMRLCVSYLNYMNIDKYNVNNNS